MSIVLIAADKFKGSLTAGDVAEALTAGIRDVDPTTQVISVPVADGGDGTLAAAVASGFTRVPVTVEGPTGELVESGYAEKDGTAVVELADACGLVRLPGGVLAPLTASSIGFGQVIAAALDAGCRRLVLAVGGSASTDGGAGMLTALGARILDAGGKPVSVGGGLEHVATLDLSGLHPALSDTQVVLASDVDNPLLGDRGAAAVYGPQKGATPDDVARLDGALRVWSGAIARALGVPETESGHPAADVAGAGAAGGVGFAAVAVLNATARPGIDLMLELTDFHRHLRHAHLVITGEGSLDEQTLHGKAPAGVAASARAAGVPVVAVAGRSRLSAEELAGAGIGAAYALSDIQPDVTRCMADAALLLRQIAARIVGDGAIDRQVGRGPHERSLGRPKAQPRRRSQMTIDYYAPTGGHPDQTELTTNRAMFTEAYAVLPRGTMRDIVTSLLPFWEKTRLWVIARPLSGFAETFSQYVVEVQPGGGSERPETDPNAEAVIFLMKGGLRVVLDGTAHDMTAGGYAFLPPGADWQVQSVGAEPARFHWIRKAYQRVEGLETPAAFFTSDEEVVGVEMPGTNGAWVTQRFADPSDLRHDMHVNIVSFLPGGAITFPETHVMEHGIYVLEGKAVYLLNQDWVEVQEGDFMWLRAFCPQACYAGGPGRFRYLLYKDVNRHMSLSRQFG